MKDYFPVLRGDSDLLCGKIQVLVEQLLSERRIIPTCHVMVSTALTNQRRLHQGWNTPYAPYGEWNAFPARLIKRGQDKCSCPLLSGSGTHQECLFARFFFLELAMLTRLLLDLQSSDQ